MAACAELDQRKRCTSCSVEKPHEEFYSKGSRLDSICKDCKKERSRTDYRFKFGPRDKERFASLVNALLDFHLDRQRQVIAELDALIGRASVERSYDQRTSNSV